MCLCVCLCVFVWLWLRPYMCTHAVHVHVHTHRHTHADSAWASRGAGPTPATAVSVCRFCPGTQWRGVPRGRAWEGSTMEPQCRGEQRRAERPNLSALVPAPLLSSGLEPSPNTYNGDAKIKRGGGGRGQDHGRWRGIPSML
jgi:hypothetical protein